MANKRVAEADLQIKLSLAPCRCDFHFVGLCERREQRLRLRDLRHFRRRSEAFKSGCEYGVGVGGAAG